MERLVRKHVFELASSCMPGDRRFNLGHTTSCTSLSGLTLSARKNVSGRLHCKAEARVSEDSTSWTRVGSPSHKFRETASRAREGTIADTTTAAVSSSPSLLGGGPPVNLAAVVGITAAVLIMAVLGFMVKPRTNARGSVSDLIRRGQLRSDRGGAGSKNLTYDDPFNNPLVKMGNKNPIVRMCGKMFRLAPVTLTEEKVMKHQNRRINAYKWKRPIVFLSEGDSVPEGIDPEEVRWIPSNHPFATTGNYIDEDLAQKNIYQTKGVPSRVRAEHEALRKKMLETAKQEPEFQLPNMENGEAQAWKTFESSRTSSGNGSEGSDSPVAFGKQFNGEVGFTPTKSGSEQCSPRKSASESQYRIIDFSVEEQGLGRTY